MPEEKKSGISGIMSKPVPSWVLVLIFLVGIGVGFGAFWVARSNNQAARVVLPVPPIEQPADKPSDAIALPSTSTQPTDAQSTSTPSSPEKNPYAEYILQPEKDTAVLSIDWTKPVRRDPSAVFSGVLEANRIAGINDYSTIERIDAAMKQMVSDYNRPVMGDAIGTWERGVVSSGKYKGYKLFEQREGISEMGGGAEFKFLIDPQNKRMLIMEPLNLELMKLYRESGGYEGAKKVYMEWEKVVTPAFSISLDPSYLKLDPQTVGGRRLESRDTGWYDAAYLDWLISSGKLSDKYVALGEKTDQGLKIFEDTGSGTACVLIQKQDGVFGTFASRIMPWDTDGQGDLTVKVQWDEKALAGRKPSETYIPTTGACDSFCPVLVDKQEDLSEGNLVRIGTVQGQPIFVPKDMRNSYSAKQAYESWFLPNGKAKPSFEEFLKQKPIPVFFWKDVFGRWVKHNDYELQPPGECGKPVIYLYPEKTTPVSVALPKFIDVTVSEPAYPENGWKVVAHPDGTLDYADGKTYGSLYWEGNGVGYATQKTGFVVKDGEQETFLTKVLAKYGLNRKEAKEFMDFWLPRMTGAPYYRVSFLTDSWSEAAPLYVSPRPDTNIRIFMDWQKLSGPISLPEPKIMAPARNGFTLVEWGGLLH